MDRRRSMIVWLLVFGLIGILSERIGAFDAPGQAVETSVRMKKDMRIKTLGNIGTETRKNIPYKERLEREFEREEDLNNERLRRERVQAAEAEAAERRRWALVRELRQRQRQQPPGRGRDRSPPRRQRSARSYDKTFSGRMESKLE